MRYAIFLSASLTLLACRSSHLEAATDAGLAAAPLAVDASALAAPGRDAGAAHPKPSLSGSNLALYNKHLAAGRAHAAAKRWPEAALSFEAALAAVPGSARALSELGYAAFFAGDLEKARRTNDLALAAAGEPAQKAQVLFNQGMVEEKQGHAEQARARYRASLALRPNAVVQKRLDALAPASPCDGAFTDLAALCSCRTTRERDILLSPGDSALTCAEQPARGVDGLKVVRWGSDTAPGESQRFLAARGKSGWRNVAEVGSDFEPGAFGVHNGASVDSITGRTVDGRRIAVVEWTQNNVDTNMAGLELNMYEAHHVTLCVLDDEPRCPVSFPLRETETLAYQRDLVDESDTETRDTLTEMEANRPAFSSETSATYTVDEHGTVKVTETRGKRPHLAPFVRGVSLW